jgi:hypothetical protein
MVPGLYHSYDCKQEFATFLNKKKPDVGHIEANFLALDIKLSI